MTGIDGEKSCGRPPSDYVDEAERATGILLSQGDVSYVMAPMMPFAGGLIRLAIDWGADDAFYAGQPVGDIPEALVVLNPPSERASVNLEFTRRRFWAALAQQREQWKSAYDGADRLACYVNKATESDYVNIEARTVCVRTTNTGACCVAALPSPPAMPPPPSPPAPSTPPPERPPPSPPSAPSSHAPGGSERCYALTNRISLASFGWANQMYCHHLSAHNATRESAYSCGRFFSTRTRSASLGDVGLCAWDGMSTQCHAEALFSCPVHLLDPTPVPATPPAPLDQPALRMDSDSGGEAGVANTQARQQDGRKDAQVPITLASPLPARQPHQTLAQARDVGHEQYCASTASVALLRPFAFTAAARANAFLTAAWGEGWQNDDDHLRKLGMARMVQADTVHL